MITGGSGNFFPSFFELVSLGILDAVVVVGAVDAVGLEDIGGECQALVVARGLERLRS